MNLSANPAPYAIKLLKENQDKINWKWLSFNPNDEAIELLNSNLNRNNKINWAFLSANPNPEAIKLLKKYPKNIDWWNLSKNTNPEAIELS